MYLNMKKQKNTENTGINQVPWQRLHIREQSRGILSSKNILFQKIRLDASD